MRHFLLSGPVTALSFGVGVTTAQTRLIAATGGTHGAPAGLVGALRSAVAMATITMAANEHGGATAGAQVASSGKVHWHTRPMGSPRGRPLCGILRVQRRPSGLRGAASELAWQLGPVSRLRFHRPVGFLPHRQRRRYRDDVHRTFTSNPCRAQLPDDGLAQQSVRRKPCGQQTVKPAYTCRPSKPKPLSRVSPTDNRSTPNFYGKTAPLTKGSGSPEGDESQVYPAYLPLIVAATASRAPMIELR